MSVQDNLFVVHPTPKTNIWMAKSIAQKDGIHCIYGVWKVQIPSNFSHPGGWNVLKQLENQNIAQFFETTRGGRGHSEYARSLLKKFVVGYTTKAEPTHMKGTLVTEMNLSFKNIVKNVTLGTLFILLHLVVFAQLGSKE